MKTLINIWAVAAIFGAIAFAATIKAVSAVEAQAHVEWAKPIVIPKPAYSEEAEAFLAITPRTEWPALMADCSEERLALKFIEGAEEVGADLDQNQIDTVYNVIAPRLRELIARSVDRYQKEYWFWYWRPGAIREAIFADREKWGAKYDGAIAELVGDHRLR